VSKQVSVIICTYNYGRFLRQCLESVVHQTHPVDEVIVVDDGSQDNTHAITREYSQVRYLRQENAGKAAAFNRGFATASGDIICHLDADDYWMPNKVERLVQVLEQENSGGVTHDTMYVDGSGGTLYGDQVQGCLEREVRRIAFPELLLMCFIYPPRNSPPAGIGVANTICVWRDAVSDLFPVPTSLGLAIDGALILGAARRGLVYLPEKLSAYRHHGSNSYVGDPKSEEYQIRLHKWARGLLGIHADRESDVLKARTLELEVHSALAMGRNPVRSAAKAALLVRMLVQLGLVPHWKNFALPVACLFGWRRVRYAFARIWMAASNKAKSGAVGVL
jgi:glycosyltransferase involved in cell wall biosynthesis